MTSDNWDLESGSSSLDNPAWASLTGPHAGLAIRAGAAARYPAHIGPIAALERAGMASLADLARITSPGDVVAVLEASEIPDSDWFRTRQRVEIRQMVCEQTVEPAHMAPQRLSGEDAREMLELARLTQPGPFAERTGEMGVYVGFREDGRLAAMGGERLRPQGLTEVSAICTHPEFRGRGFAEAIVRWLSREIQSRDEIPFLHVAVGSPSELAAAALYARVGFRDRRRLPLVMIERTATDPSD